MGGAHQRIKVWGFRGACVCVCVCVWTRRDEKETRKWRERRVDRGAESYERGATQVPGQAEGLLFKG